MHKTSYLFHFTCPQDNKETVKISSMDLPHLLSIQQAYLSSYMPVFESSFHFLLFNILRS